MRPIGQQIRQNLKRLQVQQSRMTQQRIDFRPRTDPPEVTTVTSHITTMPSLTEPDDHTVTLQAQIDELNLTGNITQTPAEYHPDIIIEPVCSSKSDSG
jgi:hypothetical protein